MKHAQTSTTVGKWLRPIVSIVLAMAIVVIGSLAFLAAVSTSYITTKSSFVVFEHTFFLPDNPVLNLLAFVMLVLFLYLLSTRLPRAEQYLESHHDVFVRIRLACIALAGVMCIVWLVATQPIPRADQDYMLQAAQRSLQGDWSDFSDSGYIGGYRNQIGLFWVLRFFAWAFGPNNILPFELANVACAMVMLWELSEIEGILVGSWVSQIAVLLVAILFFPMLQYVTFVYGNVAGLAFALVAIRHELVYLASQSIKDAIVSAICIGFAILLKGNYIIFLIGMLIYALLLSQQAGLRAAATLVALACCSYVVFSVVPTQAARAMSNEKLDQGCSPWSWIAMGAQGGELAPGWWNNYNLRSYGESGFNTQTQEAMAKQALAKSYAKFAEDVPSAIRFLLQKTASQWNNPTFEGFCIAQTAEFGNQGGWLATRFGSDAWTLRAYWFLNVLQFIILVGALAWCVTSDWWQEDALKSTILVLVFLGGFACHVFWEAKCQYTLPYFELLIPLAINGYARIVELLGVLRDGPQSVGALMSNRHVVHPIKLVALVCTVAIIAVLCFGGHLGEIRGDANALAEYIDQVGMPAE